MNNTLNSIDNVVRELQGAVMRKPFAGRERPFAARGLSGAKTHVLKHRHGANL